MNAKQFNISALPVAESLRTDAVVMRQDSYATMAARTEAAAKIVERLLAERNALLEALKVVSRLDYLQEHNALADIVRNAISLSEKE